MKSAASKQNNMTKICQLHQNKGEPYVFTHDPRFINLFDIWNEEVTMQHKRLLNNNKMSNRKITVYTNEELENGGMKHDMKKAHFTSTT